LPISVAARARTHALDTVPTYVGTHTSPNRATLRSVLVQRCMLSICRPPIIVVCIPGRTPSCTSSSCTAAQTSPSRNTRYFSICTAARCVQAAELCHSCLRCRVIPVAHTQQMRSAAGASCIVVLRVQCDSHATPQKPLQRMPTRRASREPTQVKTSRYSATAPAARASYLRRPTHHGNQS